ncbi:MAG TPA: fibrobacter succinogenes major paralogous domain-containing protein, partial [Bacteroidales bacterium]|nr:fibrobacter succinogenes major paralogous domain-containing protein [Bacteroidales bacterium]
TITDIEGNSYYTVTINNQVWMAENLNTRTFNNGDPIPTTTPADLDISGENSPEYQWSYAGDEANAEVYGRLYTYYTVADTRGVCPTGWHVPTNNDIISLRDFLGGYLICGGKLKEAGTSHWMLPNTGATNETGFTGIPGGIRFSSGQYAAIYGTGQWWTSTEDLSTPDTDNAYSVNLASQVIVFGVGGSSSKSHGFSVRCLKD